MVHCGVGRLELRAPCLDEVDEVFLVAGVVGGVRAVLVALPPDEARDLVALVGILRVAFAEIVEHVVDGGGVVVILLAGIPAFAGLGFTTFPSASRVSP